MNKQHFRKLLGKEFLTGEELDGKDVTLTIKTATQDDVQGQKGKEKKLVLTFEKTDRKLILNITNAKAISKVAGSGFVEDWIGVPITLMPVKGVFFGEAQEVIRIKQEHKKLYDND